MKKDTIISLLSSVLILGSMSSCGESGSDAAADIPDSSPVSEAVTTASVADSSPDDSFETIPVLVERSGIWTNLDDLISHSDAVVIGEFTSDEGTEYFYQYPEQKKELFGAVTKAGLKIEKVLAGTLDEESIVLCENYCFQDDRPDGRKLILFTELAPMNIGEKWIIFLTRSEDGSWWTTSDANGRYPLPEQLGKPDALGFVNGRYEEDIRFDENLCREIYERFDLT